MPDAGRDGLSDSVTGALRWATISRVLTQLLTWGTTLLVVRLLSPADYGLAAMAGILAGYLAMWNELGLSVTLIQRRTVDDATLRAVLGLLLAVGALLALLMALASPLIARAFGDARVTPLACLVSVNFLIMPFVIIPHAQLSIDMNMRALSLVGLISAAVGAAITLGLAFVGFGAYALVLGSLAVTAARAVALNVAAAFLKAPSWRPRMLRNFASVSMSVMLSRTIWYWYTEADNLIVGRLLGANLLGIYSLGRQLALMPMDRASEIANMVALPAYSSVGHDLPRVRDAYLRSIRLVATAAFPIFWGLALVADNLVQSVLGNRWMAAVPVLQILCIVMPLRTVATLAIAPLLAIGRADSSLLFAVFPALLVPISLLIGVRWGVGGVATAWVLAYPVAFLVTTYWTRSAFGASLRQILSPMAAPALSAALMFAIVTALMHLVSLPALALLSLKVSLGCSIYSAILAVVSRPHFNDVVGFTRRLLVYRRAAP